jgi:Ca2+-binding RTX toxin-like protein
LVTKIVHLGDVSALPRLVSYHRYVRGAVVYRPYSPALLRKVSRDEEDRSAAGFAGRSTQKDDRIVGSDGSDYFVVGGRGADLISGGQGYDGLMGDRGDDVLKGGSSRDELHGWWGGDTIIGGEGPDHIEPNPWWGYPQEEDQDTEDNVEAGPGNDDIYMGYLDETVDHVDCGDGTDWVWESFEGDGQDTFVNCENIGQ